ncbi:hypothetical protein A2276_01740 [candidate division WOR-1 bacterium RIFOXYA12_FULL_43_27]|uniref:Uncharacterized protein n=1 Tax=candidate division WOR-1 bacterium RIFOXYC2_FULL_46_14 TaxID=1802587 RepID=A0A1F4U6L4_UNCSA|nr:MAG: hypothetical protein A2276_01740 [candidate division WOR-1 bacterium RIFOXYA12_FULL_43_27]OGC19553.1 MAG: hypothetical protein A2292_02590 [candidate division WOR-1 bacterium RIFOXYB2_FULL_46_45]OGC30541.1 MAG: hypothetical protein A2232_02590 [candidate division WOR-1 bacterium RIFOXYA2_FULL_46_56]OGC40608.1 MAG: hypothetical protein A2438_06305 [candidate division WOR-1 bacterium RIFOXYC2_FULL_46_14]
MKKIAFYTLGCRANQYETDVLKRQFPDCEIVEPFKEKADVIVINSCVVTHDAERKSRQAIRRALREAKEVYLTGCYSKLNKVTIDGVKILEKKEWKNAKTSRVRANLMIENGCENFCAYCIVPYVRGKIRSRNPKDVLCEAQEMVKNGAREIVLTGINLGAYQHSLMGLIKELAKIKELLRIRLSSIEPMYVTDELIETVAKTPKACRFFHIPLQCGDDQLLKSMGRIYTAKEYINIIHKIRKAISECGISTDIIVGLPGEDEKAFNNTVKLVNELKFSNMHLFPYSKRNGTRAATMPNQVYPKIIKRRMLKLQKLKEKYSNQFRNKYIGKEVEILVEQPGEGLTDNFIRVRFKDIKNRTGKIKKIPLYSNSISNQ